MCFLERESVFAYKIFACETEIIGAHVSGTDVRQGTFCATRVVTLHA